MSQIVSQHVCRVTNWSLISAAALSPLLCFHCGKPHAALWLQLTGKQLIMSSFPSSGLMKENRVIAHVWYVSALNNLFIVNWCNRLRYAWNELCTLCVPQRCYPFKLKPYLLFPPSDAAAVTLVIHSVLILYYYANNKQAETFQR